MAYCTKCGAALPPDVSFCIKCGKRVTPPHSEPKPVSASYVERPDETGVTKATTDTSRKTVYEGYIHKCPECGQSLDSFCVRCPVCGHEVRDSSTSGIISGFVKKSEMCKNEAEKIAFIKNFPIPNTKEDIMEFLLLAYTNFDGDYYASHLNCEDVSDAWFAKIEQCYYKAKLVFSTKDIEFLHIQNIYDAVVKKISKGKAKNRNKIILGIVVIAAVLLILASPYILSFIFAIFSY